MKAQAPAWLARLATPFMARHIAGAMARQHPGLTPGQIVEKMRADLGANPNPQALALVNAVERYLPQPAPSGAEERRPLSAVVLVIANLVPLYGVLFLGWDAFALILLFWLENVVIGVLNVARMLCVDPHDAALWAAKLFMVPFFCFHRPAIQQKSTLRSTTSKPTSGRGSLKGEYHSVRKLAALIKIPRPKRGG